VQNDDVAWARLGQGRYVAVVATLALLVLGEGHVVASYRTLVSSSSGR